jgi:hypothetical protein
VKYDEKAQNLSDALKSQCLCIEAMINPIANSREKALALTALEETFMWIGKAIRSDLLNRNEGEKKNV